MDIKLNKSKPIEYDFFDPENEISNDQHNSNYDFYEPQDFEQNTESDSIIVSEPDVDSQLEI